MQISIPRSQTDDWAARALATLALIVCASIPAYFGWFPIRNLFTEYQDSTPQFYAAVGASLWSLAAVLVSLTLPLLGRTAAAVWALIAGVALTAVALPYSVAFSSHSRPTAALREAWYAGWVYFFDDLFATPRLWFGFLIQLALMIIVVVAGAKLAAAVRRR